MWDSMSLTSWEVILRTNMKFVAQNRLIGEFAISQGSNCNAWTRIIIFYQQINWIVLILFNKSNHLLTAIEASVQTITFCQAHFNTIQPHSILCECGTGDNCRFCTHLRLLRNDFNFTQNIEIIDCERMTCRYTNLVCGKGAANWVIDWQNEFLIAFTPWKSSKPNHYSACLWSPNGVNEEFVMHSECYQPNESDATMSFVINDLKQIPEHSIGASPYIGEKKNFHIFLLLSNSSKFPIGCHNATPIYLRQRINRTISLVSALWSLLFMIGACVSVSTACVPQNMLKFMVCEHRRSTNQSEQMKTYVNPLHRNYRHIRFLLVLIYSVHAAQCT